MKGIALLLLCAAAAAQASPICTQEMVGVMLPHPKCDHFYTCFFGSATEQYCGDGLLFNPELQVCDWPFNVDCGDRIIPPRKLIAEKNTKTDNRSPAEICAEEGSEDLLLDHEYCDKYYKCNNGKPVTMPCPPNLLWLSNRFNQFCYWADQVDCGDRIRPESFDQEPDDGVNDNLTPAEIFCNQPGTWNVIFAHENCNQYYQCISGKPILMSCPSPLVFNLERGFCDWPVRVNCQDRIIPDDISGDGGNNDLTPAEIFCNQPGTLNIIFAHENCNQYYQCFFGKPLELSCPANLFYDLERHICDWPENVNCANRIKPDGISSGNPNDDDKVSEQVSGGNSDPSQAPAICAAEDSDGVLVAHENCNQFYKCFDRQPVALDCPQNLLYNPEKEYCDWEWNVNCGNRIKPDDISSGNPSDDKGPEQISGGNSDPSQAPAICAAEDSDGVLVAHENCNQFYKCFDGQPVALDCPQNLLYNPEKEYCDWPWNVDCGNRVIPSKIVIAEKKI